MKEIELTKGFVALVDDEDYAAISAYSWYAHQPKESVDVVYAMRRTKCKITGKQRIYKMHREIMGVSDQPKRYIDHIDRNGLNNTRANLRFVNQMQNQGNRRMSYRTKPPTSKYKGVYFHAGKYEASLRAWGKKKYLGRFDTEEAAAKAYDDAAAEAWGPYARLNFPETPKTP